MNTSYADSSVWDRRFEQSGDLDWGGLWVDPFVDVLRVHGCRTILDLGCGTGNDVARLSKAGFRVTGLEFSDKAISMAQSKSILGAKFIQADMAQTLPFTDDNFDAVFSNVALHMFDDATTQGIITEVKRVLKLSGQFIFHVNSTEDRELRAARKPVLEELGENRIREKDGQTVHFFFKEELESLFLSWAFLRLEHIEIPDIKTGKPFKRVWRGIVTS